MFEFFLVSFSGMKTWCFLIASVASEFSLVASPVRVGCSLPPVAGLIRQIGGEGLSCVSMVRELADPHAFEPTPRDLAALDGIKLYFAGDMDFERFLRDKLAARGVEAEFITLDGDDHGESAGAVDDNHHHADPHGWLSPVILEKWADEIAVELERCGLAGSAARAAALKADCRKVLEEGRARIERCGVKAFVSVHPALGPFSEAFGIEQIALEHEGKAPGLRQIAKARQRVLDTGASTIFVQNDSERRTAESFSRGMSLRIVQIRPLATDPLATVRSALDAICQPFEMGSTGLE